jgi:hypothetical protein
MHLSPEPDNKPAIPSAHYKNIATLIDTLREKESGIRRDHHISSIIDDTPKNYPKLLDRDPVLR